MSRFLFMELQEYRVVEFDVHYVNKDPEGWFGRKDEIVCE